MASSSHIGGDEEGMGFILARKFGAWVMPLSLSNN